jgi:adenine deaminase
MAPTRVLAVARGEEPADVVLRGATVLDVCSGAPLREDIAVAEGRIAGLGPGYEGVREVDLAGALVLPGFIDAHVHIESSLTTPAQFARTVVPRGTTAVVADPHEIANVHGTEGIRWMLDASEGLPLAVFVMASSCVPATTMSTSGAALDADALATLATHPRVIGLAEVMNFPGVIHGDPGLERKLEAFRGLPVDGHAPGVLGHALNAYRVGGPTSDHESTHPDEATEKLRRGMRLFLREATNARNLDALLPIVTETNARRISLCTDDRQPPDLLEEGGIDMMLRRVIRSGLSPVEAIRMATLNTAEHFGLRDRGLLAPGCVADLVVVASLEELDIRQVWCRGRLTARDGKAVAWPSMTQPPAPAPAMRVDVDGLQLRIPARGERVRVIEVVPDQLATGSGVAEARIEGGEALADPSRDLLKIAVVERHAGSGRVGLGFVRGMGLKAGAMAGTVAHDHHNVIVVGTDDRSMRAAVRAVAGRGGGLAVTRDDDVLALLSLPVAGLMSTEPIEDVARALKEVVAAARSLGSPLHDPFMAMSFLGLEVIPALKITDHGLVDVDAFTPVDLWV